MHAPAGDAVYRTLRTVGDAWSWLILRDALLYDARRFSEFQRRTGAARATLVARLAQLVDGRLLERREGGGYVPSAAGEDFLGCLLCAWRWGATWYESDEDPPPPTHLSCGRPLSAVLRCAACREVVDAREVTWSTRLALEATPAAARQRAPRRELLERGGPSPLARTLAVIGDWWTSLVIREAFYGTRRFQDFERRTGAAPNILAARLNHLVDQGVLERRPNEYRLTAKGLDLYHVPLAMMAWADRWAGPSPAPVTLAHNPCGQPLRPQLSCGDCAGDVTRSTLSCRASA